jgi:hypothetical protein
MLICLHEEGRASETEMRQCAASVADLLTGSRDLPRLAAACARLLGVLQFPQEADALMAALKAPGSAARIEPTASICIALGRLRRSEAVPPLRELMSAAEEESLFDASVYALGQIGTIDALDALNDAGDRFHTGSVGAVIRLDYSQTVERLLRESVEPEALNIALEAAQHLTNPDDCADALLERLQEGSLPPEVRPRTLAFFHDAASGEICRRAVALLPPPSEPNEEWRRLALRADAGALVSWLGQEPARGAKP